MNNNYEIKENYKFRDNVEPFNDIGEKDNYQDPVYKKAYTFSPETIFDIGTGSGFKLLKWFKDKKTIGSEIGITLDYLKKEYPDRRWVQSDFSQNINEHFDIVICADVVEHLIDPNELMRFIATLEFNKLVISTPERFKNDLITEGRNSIGPPLNKFHIREWSDREFEAYISNYFKVIDSSFFWNTSVFAQIVIAEKL